MLNQSTADITRECDRLSRECDTVLNSACVADMNIDRLRFSAGITRAQIERLDKAQADVDQQRRSLAKKLFWFKLRPSQLLYSIRHAFNSFRPNPLTTHQPGSPRSSLQS